MVMSMAKSSATSKAAKSALGSATGGASVVVEKVLSSKHRGPILGAIGAALFAVLIAVQVIFASLVSVIGGSASNAVAAVDTAVTASSGASSSTIQTIQDSTQSTPTPWTVLTALMYYESGVGATVAHTAGVCPSGAPATPLCPSTLTLPSGALTGGTATSSGGPVNMSVDTLGSATPGPTSGYETATGRNGTVPVSLPANSPDFVTTNTADWDCIRQAESGDNYTQTSGAYGILGSTWASLGYSGTPGQAPKSQQDAAALEILRYEGHFYGAWNDLCTDPGGTAATEISYIPPGVPNPGGGLTSGGSGTCPGTYDTSTKKWIYTYQGPYCLRKISGVNVNDLAAASTWIATDLGKQFSADGVGDAIDLTVGVSPWSGKVAILDASNTTATGYRSAILSDLATLPIKGNSFVLDKNVYDLAVAWLQGLTPQPAPGCSTLGTSTSIPGPNSSTVLLSSSQTAVAQTAVNAAVAAKAPSSVQVAIIAGALQQTGLSSPSLFTSLSGGVNAFIAADTRTSATPDLQDVAVLKGQDSLYTGWLTGAQQIVDSITTPGGNCTPYVPVPGGSKAARTAVTAALKELGLPYVWGGGGTSGPSGSAVAPPSQVGQPGFDCSGLVQYAFAQAGVNLPRTAQTQFNYVQQRGSLTTDTALLQPGDLLFYSDNEPGVNHVAIYLGKGQLIQAPQTGMDVSYGTLSADAGLGFVGGGAAA